MLVMGVEVVVVEVDEVLCEWRLMVLVTKWLLWLLW